MKKIIIFGGSENVDWASEHIKALVEKGFLGAVEHSKDPRSFEEALGYLGQCGKPQIIVFASTPTGLWHSMQLDALWETALNRNPFAVVAFAPPPDADLQEKDRLCTLWRIVDRDQTDRSAHDSLFEIFCSVFGDD